MCIYNTVKQCMLHHLSTNVFSLWVDERLSTYMGGSLTFMHVIMNADLFLKCKKLSPFTCISNMAEPHQLSDAWNNSHIFYFQWVNTSLLSYLRKYQLTWVSSWHTDGPWEFWKKYLPFAFVYSHFVAEV